jgi:hypothetical protein
MATDFFEQAAPLQLNARPNGTLLAPWFRLLTSLLELFWETPILFFLANPAM